MVKKRNSRKNTRRKYWKVIPILFLIYFSVGVIQNRDSIIPFLLERIGVNDDSHSIPVSEEWNLIVVAAVPGTSYELWHYRYVGVENAKIIYEQQICLEEYIERTE